MLRTAVLLLILPFALAVTIPLSASAALPCTNPHTATAADIAAGYPAGSQVCPNDEKAVTPDSGTAKQYLKTISSVPAWKIDQLNPAFSVCAAKFLKFAADNGKNPRVLDGARSQSEQDGLCQRYRNGTGGIAACGVGEHVQGIAIDVKANNAPWMWSNAPQFGLVFYLGARDSVHFVPLNQNSLAKLMRNAPDPKVVAQAQQNLQKGGGCLTSGFTPNVQDAAAGGLPLDQQIRQALGMQPTPPPPPPPPMQQPPQTIQQPAQAAPAQQTQSQTLQQTPPPIGTLNSTPYPAGTCNPQTYCSQSDGNIYYRATTCVDQMYQKCSRGCSGLICNATSTADSQSGSLLMPSITNDNTNTNSNQNGTSTFDLISYFANPVAVAANVATATPLDITNAVQDTGNASVLQPSGTTIQTPPQGSSGYGPVPQQTFTSSDLGNVPTGFAQPSTFQTAVANMRATLLGILSYLQPFGGRIAPFQ